MLWKLFFGKIILNFCPVLCNQVTTEECVSEGKTKEKHFPVIMPSFGRKLRKIPLQDLRSFLSAKDKHW